MKAFIQVFILALVCFVTGTVELVVGGILDLIAADFHISISAAGQLITLYSLTFALAGPPMQAFTAKFNRKKLYLTAILIFIAGNIIAVTSTVYGVLLAARIVAAASTALIMILSITIAAQLVDAKYRARAIGLIYMGVSGSLVLGVPIGLLLGNHFGWRAPFIMVVILSICVFLVIQFGLGQTPLPTATPFLQQFASLKNRRILWTHGITILMLAGHLTLYAYLTPFLRDVLKLGPSSISLWYFLLGAAAISGGGFGGWVTDRLGARRSIRWIVGCYAGVMFLLPFASASIYTCALIMIVWSLLSWAITPAIQSYLIQLAPTSSEIQQSFNSSASHVGIALGSAVGGIVLEHTTVWYNAWVGLVFVLFAFVSAMGAIKQGGQQTTRTPDGANEAEA